MSKQLAISAAFSVFAMSAFALFGTGEVATAANIQALIDGNTQTGAEAFASTPAFDQVRMRLLPDLNS